MASAPEDADLFYPWARKTDGSFPTPTVTDRIANTFGLAGSLSATDIALFAESLSGFTRSGMSLPHAIRLLGAEAGSRRMRKALQAVGAEVESGVSLADALRKQPGVFPELFVGLIEQGCAANDLHAALVEIVREYSPKGGA